MKRPLVAVALVYAGGLLLGEFFQPPLGWLCATALALGATTLLWNRVGKWLLWPMILLTGWSNMVWRTAIFSPHDLRLILGDSAEILTIRGTLSETPSQRVFLQDEKQVARWLARVETSHVQRHKANWQPMPEDSGKDRRPFKLSPLSLGCVSRAETKSPSTGATHEGLHTILYLTSHHGFHPTFAPARAFCSGGRGDPYVNAPKRELGRVFTEESKVWSL